MCYSQFLSQNILNHKRASDLRVDGSNHTILAMLALRTVEPDGLRVGNANSVSQDLVCCCERSVGRHETREEGVGFVRHDVLNGYARVVECGLGDGMVL